MPYYNHIPAQVDKHLDVLSFWNDGALFLGASNLTDRYWSGTVWYYSDPDKAPSIDACVTGRELDSGICDAVTLSNQRAFVALDSGGVELLQLTEDKAEASVTHIFSTIAYSCEHDNYLCSVSRNADETRVASGGADATIKIWDLEGFVAMNTYRYAHTDIIWTVAYHSSDPDVFASCSEEGRLNVWDTRVPRPVTRIAVPVENFTATALAWCSADSNVLALGDYAGRIMCLDVRNPQKETMEIIQPLKRRISSLKFSPDNPTWLAVCADDSKMLVTDYSAGSMKIIYTSDEHDDFVRDLSWKPGTKLLYSAGWDKKVVRHDLSEIVNYDLNEIVKQDITEVITSEQD